MPREFQRKNEISDLVKWENNPRYTRDYMTVDNTSGLTDKEVRVGECYVKDTATILTDTKAAAPAAWNVNFSDGWSVAVPEVYTIKIGGSWTADDTLTIGSTTFTAKASPTTTSASNQFSANGSGAVIVDDIKKCELAVSGFTITFDGDTITLTQSTPGTGSAPACTLGGSNAGTGTAVLTNIQNYHAADTVTIGSTTYTCANGELTSSQIPTGTGAEVVARLKALSAACSGFDLSYSGNSITFTQSSASGTENAPTASCSANVAALTTTKIQSYAAAVDGNTSSIDFWCCENKVIPAGTKATVLGLVRGPALVDLKNVICENESGMKAQLESKGIVTMIPSPQSVYQET